MRALAIVWDAATTTSPAETDRSEASEASSVNHVQCARIAEACFHLGTTAALYPAGPTSNSTSSGRDSTSTWSAVCLDVTGCARLFGKTMEEGERAMVAEAGSLASELSGEPGRVHVVIADGPRIALAVAAFGKGAAFGEGAAFGSGAGGGARVVVPPGEARLAMSRLPIASLPLPLPTRAWLSRLGISRVSELCALPRKELGSRLGAAEKDVFSLAEGDDRAPLVPYVPPATPEETVELDVGIDSHEALAFVLKTLTARMSSRLAGRGVAVSRMEVVLSLDVAALTGKRGERVRAEGRRREDHTEVVVLPAPLASEKDLFVVLRAKMERVTLAAPVRGVTLRVTELSDKPARALSLFSALPRAEGVLARLAGELSVEGCAVGELGLADTWDPAQRSQLLPLGSARNSRKKKPEVASPFDPAPEPTLLLAEDCAIAIDRREMKPVRFLSRVEQLQWWQGERVAFDRVMGRVGDRLACVVIHRATGQAEITGFFD